MLKHILKHCWWWPLEFILQPHSILDRRKKNEYAELISALVGGGLWGALVGYLLWITGYGEIYSIWIIAVAFTFAGAGALAGVLVGAGVDAGVDAGIDDGIDAGVGIFTFIFAFSVTVIVTVTTAVTPSAAVAVSAAVTVAFVAAIAGTFTVAVTVTVGIYLTLIPLLGILLSAWLGESITRWLFTISTSVSFMAIFSTVILNKDNTWIINAGSIGWIITTPLLAFGLFPFIPQSDHSTVSISLIIALAIGFLAGTINTQVKADKASSQIIAHSLLPSLILLIAFPAFVAWYNPWGSEQLQQLLHTLALCLLAFPVLFSGLLFYPLLIIIALKQFRIARVETHDITFKKSLPFVYQTLALPLPRLDSYLATLAKRDIGSAYQAMLLLQEHSFQGMAAAKVARKLLTSDIALEFMGFIAQETNIQTLLPLWQASNFARAVIVLQPLINLEESEKYFIRLYIYTLNQNLNQGEFNFITPQKIQAKKAAHYSIWHDLKETRKRTLNKRIKSAKSYLAETSEANDKKTYQNLLDDLLSITSIEDFQALSHTVPNLIFHPISKSISKSEWLKQGYEMLGLLQKHCEQLNDYPVSENAELKKSVLRSYQVNLLKIQWTLSDYWQRIADELVKHWQTIYQQEINEFHDWLQLNIQVVNSSIIAGNTSIQLKIHNVSKVVAQKLHLTLQTTEGIQWQSSDFAVPGLIDIDGQQALVISALIEAQGRVVMNGQLTAEDLDGRYYQWPVNLELNVNTHAKPYQHADKIYYIAGPCLSRDDKFAGREQLMHKLRMLWVMPENKEALLLIGLRRMGKSSLLEKVRRDGLGEQLIPVYVDLQGYQNLHDFYRAVVAESCQLLAIDTYQLDAHDLNYSFLKFIAYLKQSILAGRYLLIMIDEANFFADSTRDYGGLQDNLRALMQAKEHPVLLLFCGTHELREGANDYQSILFNTCRTQYVSYVSNTVANEILIKPAKGFLEYDPQALALGFKLTGGHPYLLQALGAKIIEQFDEAVTAKKERSNYVIYDDMEAAGNTLSEDDNAAFSTYWQDAELYEQLVFSLMAHHLDESNRKAISLEGILAEATQYRVALEPSQIFETIKRYVKQDLLMRFDDHYTFRIPLFRRWINWQYPIRELRESVES